MTNPVRRTYIALQVFKISLYLCNKAGKNYHISDICRCRYLQVVAVLQAPGEGRGGERAVPARGERRERGAPRRRARARVRRARQV